MPAHVETAFFGNNKPFWHGLGTVVEGVKTAKEALVLAGLDWDVELRPLFISNEDGNEQFIPEDDGLPSQAVVRVKDNKILGVVGSRYRVWNNYQGFEFVDDLLKTGEAKWDTAGSLLGGQKIWMLAEIPGIIYLKGEATEEVRKYVLFTNGHDGKTPITVKITPTRVGCANTLAMALAGDHKREYTVRHTEGAAPKVDEARQILGIAHRYFDELEVVGNKMIDTKVTDKTFNFVLDRLFPVANARTDRMRNNAVAERDTITKLYKDSANLQNVRGTQWAVINAVSEFNDHYAPGRNTDKSGGNNMAENRMKRILRDTSLVDKALAILQPEHASAEALALVKR